MKTAAIIHDAQEAVHDSIGENTGYLTMFPASVETARPCFVLQPRQKRRALCLTLCCPCGNLHYATVERSRTLRHLPIRARVIIFRRFDPKRSIKHYANMLNIDVVVRILHLLEPVKDLANKTIAARFFGCVSATKKLITCTPPR